MQLTGQAALTQLTRAATQIPGTSSEHHPAVAPSTEPPSSMTAPPRSINEGEPPLRFMADVDPNRGFWDPDPDDNRTSGPKGRGPAQDEKRSPTDHDDEDEDDEPWTLPHQQRSRRLPIGFSVRAAAVGGGVAVAIALWATWSSTSPTGEVQSARSSPPIPAITEAPSALVSVPPPVFAVGRTDQPYPTTHPDAHGSPGPADSAAHLASGNDETAAEHEVDIRLTPQDNIEHAFPPYQSATRRTERGTPVALNATVGSVADVRTTERADLPRPH